MSRVNANLERAGKIVAISVSSPLSAELARRLEVRIESDPAQVGDARKAIEQYAAELGFDERATADVGLCVNEAIANIIRHAYGDSPANPIVMQAEWIDPWMHLTLRDWGSGVNPASQPQKPYDPLVPGGVGLICLTSLMDEVTYVPQLDGMLLKLSKKKQATAP